MFSSLCDIVMRSPNHSGLRVQPIDTITIHHTAGKVTAEQIGWIFLPESRQASCNYGIGFDGKIIGVVDEENRSWCSSSWYNDQRAITIEVSNDGGEETGWHVSDESLQSLVKLLVDICKRRNIADLKWQNNPNLIGQVDKQNMTIHQWFAATGCPGPYLLSMHYWIASSVNALLKNSNGGDKVTQAEWNEMMKNYRKDLQDNDYSSWSFDARNWAVENGIILGSGTDADGDANFAWQDFVSREQMVMFLMRLDEKFTKDLSRLFEDISALNARMDILEGKAGEQLNLEG